MNRKNIEQDMRQVFGASFVSKKQITQYLGYKKTDSVNKIVQGLEMIGKRYFIPDVAQRIVEEIK